MTLNDGGTVSESFGVSLQMQSRLLQAEITRKYPPSSDNKENQPKGSYSHVRKVHAAHPPSLQLLQRGEVVKDRMAFILAVRL